MEFTICGSVAVSCWTIVEADSLQEAIEIAKDRQLAEANIDGSYPDDECWHFDTDGVPDKLRGEDD